VGSAREPWSRPTRWLRAWGRGLLLTTSGSHCPVRGAAGNSFDHDTLSFVQASTIGSPAKYYVRHEGMVHWSGILAIGKRGKEFDQLFVEEIPKSIKILL
jgi:hypothetical protein